MDIKNISNLFGTSKQIDKSDLSVIKDLNFEIIVCNRPDGEAPNQASFADIKQAAQLVGLDAVHLPYSATQLTNEIIKRFESLMSEGKKIFAYCGTGNRACNMWAAVALKNGQDINAVLNVSNEYGYDIKSTLERYALLNNG